MEISNQKSGDNSTNLQVGGDITVNSNTVALYSIEEVSKQLLDSVFGGLPEETKTQISQNQTSYFQALSENLQKIVKESSEVKKIIDLKILTLCFLLKRTKCSGLTNLDRFKQYLEQKIKPFIDFKRTTAEFEHIAYAGCASINIASHDIIGLSKGNFLIFSKKATISKNC